MFDTPGVAPTMPSPLDARVIDAFCEDLSRSLASPSGFPDAHRLDAIRALERLSCVATAAQAQLAVELDTSRRAERATAGVPAPQQGRGIAHELAQARRESPHRGQRHLGLAKAVIGEMPATWSAWRTGRITEWKATLLARETACLSRPDRLVVDQKVAENADRLEEMSVRQVVAAAQAEASRLDPASVVARRRLAESERRVTLRPAPDTMTWLTALLPVQQGVAAYAELTRAAKTARASGDSRSHGQVMADALVARVLKGTPTEPVPSPIRLNLVMTDHDLFGSSDEPAHLDGFGPIPAELARELVAGSCTRGESLWLRRLYAHPATGELAAVDARARRFKGSLARFIRLRDRECRTPWCDAPVRHLDHVVDRQSAGSTSASNGQALCEACNYAKQAPGWQARSSPHSDGHEVETTLPTGHRYRSRPPPLVATIRRTPIHLEYICAA